VNDVSASFAASRLGFGCSALVGGRSRRKARYLLDVAFSEGILHYDVARLYGSGDAEAIVGEFAAARRDQVTIASKFGLRSRVPGGPAKVAIRTATRRSKRLLRLVRRHSHAAVSRGAFSPAEMRESLEQSLRALKTDSLDLWLLHDCEPRHWLDEALLAELEAAVRRGDVRRVGTATGFENTCRLVEEAPRRPDVVQFEDDPTHANAAAFRARFGFDAIVTHGAFREGFAQLRDRLRDDEGTAREWTRVLGVDVRSEDMLAALVLAAVLDANPHGAVLFSSGSVERIRANARVASTHPFTADQLQEFRRLARTSS
jgi:D-threo-aldose 1-dehydrogenase